MTAQTKLFFLTKCFVLLSCIKTALVEDFEAERLMAELQLNDLELVDICEELAKGQKTALLSQNYEDQIEQEQLLRQNVKSHYEVLRTFTEVPIEVERNWTYQVKPGDALLPEKKIGQVLQKVCFTNVKYSCKQTCFTCTWSVKNGSVEQDRNQPPITLKNFFKQVLLGNYVSQRHVTVSNRD